MKEVWSRRKGMRSRRRHCVLWMLCPSQDRLVKTSWKLFPPTSSPTRLPSALIPTVSVTLPFVQTSVSKPPLCSGSRHPSYLGSQDTSWVFSFLSVAGMLLLSADIFYFRARKNSKRSSPLLVKPLPGFSREPGKEERSQHVRNSSEVPRIPHA